MNIFFPTGGQDERVGKIDGKIKGIAARHLSNENIQRIGFRHHYRGGRGTGLGISTCFEVRYQTDASGLIAIALSAHGTVLMALRLFCILARNNTTLFFSHHVNISFGCAAVSVPLSKPWQDARDVGVSWTKVQFQEGLP